MSTAKPFNIPKKEVYEAYLAVKANKGAAGVDRQSMEAFEEDLANNLYKLWNRMSSGTYFPPPVKAVAIPKKSGGERILGVPTITDRIAQMVVKRSFEPKVEPVFHADSYGYRPGKSALDAVGVTRTRCWKWDWVLEFDIKGLFDSIDHELMMRAVRHHTESRWELLYIERWLKAPMQLVDGTLAERAKGTPQGGVISPVLSNLFLHYVFDQWMVRTYPEVEWCRYADDGLIHCRTVSEAEMIKVALATRLLECGLEMHPEKTKIVYCKDGKRRGKYAQTKFDFLGYTFRRRVSMNSRTGEWFVNFTPAVSGTALKSMRQRTRKLNLRNRTELTMRDLSRYYNPILRGWIEYYGRFCPSALYPLYRHVNTTLVAWAERKYERLRGKRIAAGLFIERIAEQEPRLFVHWERGTLGSFV